MAQSGQSDFIRSKSAHAGRIAACSWPCERTHPVRRRSLNAAARPLPHCRHRHRRSRCSIRTLSGVSRWPLPQWSGISLEALLQRRSARENGMTSVLLVAIAPPLPTKRGSGSANLRARYLQHPRRCQRARIASRISARSSRRLCAPALALRRTGIPIGDECPRQLSLLLQAPRPKPKPRRAVTGKSDRPRILALDQRMSTAEVLRVVGVNRSTLFRWIQKGRFSRKPPSYATSTQPLCRAHLSPNSFAGISA